MIGNVCGDILEAVERIQRYASRGRAAFDDDELIQTWVVHNLQVIGEAARAITETTKSQRPEVPWRKVVGMRHILVHGYFEIDSDVVWVVVERDLARLTAAVEALLADPRI